MNGDGIPCYTNDNIPISSYNFNNINGMTMNSSGNLVISHSNKILKIQPDNVVVKIAGGGASLGDGGLAVNAQVSPYGIDYDSNGNLYLAGGYRIRKIGTDSIINTICGDGTSGTSDDGLPALTSKLQYTYSLVVDGFNNIIFNEVTTPSAVKIKIIPTVSGNYYGRALTANYIYTLTSYSMAQGKSALTCDNNNNLYWLQGSVNPISVKKMDQVGTISTIAGPGTVGTGLGDGGLAINAQLFAYVGSTSEECGLAVDQYGRVYISTSYRVRMVY